MRVLLATFALLAALLPCASSAVAAARWSKPVSLPEVPAPWVGAVDDQGRATLVYGGDENGLRVGRFDVHKRLTSVALPNVGRIAGLGLGPDGAAVGVGSREIPNSDPDAEQTSDPHALPCCSLPMAFRWAPGAVAPAVVEVPLTATPTYEYDLSTFAVGADGAAVFVAQPVNDGLSAWPFALVRVPADGSAAVVRHVPEFATDVRIAPGSAAAIWRTNGERPTFQRVALDPTLDAAPQTVRPAAPLRVGERVLLDGRGRLVRALVGRGRKVMVSVDRGAPRAVATLGHSLDEWSFAVGADGTASVVVLGAHRRLRLSTVDPRGRVHTARTVGTLAPGGTYALAVDGRGHAHVAWRAGKARIAVRGPGGTRRFAVVPGRGSSLGGLAVSAGGGELLRWSTDGRRYAAATAAPMP